MGYHQARGQSPRRVANRDPLWLDNCFQELCRIRMSRPVECWGAGTPGVPPLQKWQLRPMKSGSLHRDSAWPAGIAMWACVAPSPGVRSRESHLQAEGVESPLGVGPQEPSWDVTEGGGERLLL